VRVSLRFEVFKRDRFTCVYYGRTPPNVLLEVDHVMPQAAGGTDEFANLITACMDCNRGKGSRMLEEGRSPAVTQQQIDDARERVEQAKAHLDLLADLELVVDMQADALLQRWCDTFNGNKTASGWECDVSFPNRRTLRYFLKHLPVSEVFEAVDITGSKFDYPRGEKPSRYFYGICHRKIREATGGGDPA